MSRFGSETSSIIVLLTLFLISQLVVAESSFPSIPPSVIIIPSNPGVYFAPQIVETNSLNTIEASVSVSELSSVFCTSPSKDQTCSCKIIGNFDPKGENLAQFQCDFRPPVEGTYLINAESDKKKMRGTFSVVMRPGERPIIEQKIVQKEFPWLFTVLIGVLIIGIVCAYLLYRHFRKTK
ncbi:hypothetical protein HY989_02650 [Candidatus Micrarchaeota archaeon]|nr:hypothetical protein [Candidatus Micrarchaeota archaeon]